MSACGNNYNLLSARDSVSQILTCTQRWSTIWANLPLWMLIQRVNRKERKCDNFPAAISCLLYPRSVVRCSWGKYGRTVTRSLFWDALVLFFIPVDKGENLNKRVTQKSPHSSIYYGSLSSCLTSSWIIVISAALWYFLTFIRSPKLNATAETWWTERRRIAHQRESGFTKPSALNFPSSRLPPVLLFLFSAVCFHWRLKHLHLN